MPALNFTKFIDKLLEAKKPHTIRRTLPRGWEKGKELTLYKGMRTKNCIKLLKTKCSHFCVLKINSENYEVEAKGLGAKFNNKEEFMINGKNYRWLDLSPREIKILAQNDGFKNEKEFFEYFKDYKEPCFLLYFDKILHIDKEAWALNKKGYFK